MAKTIYKKKIKNGKEYYFYRLRHKSLKNPKDLYGSTVRELEEKIRDLKNELNNNITDNKEFFGVFFKDWLYNTHMNNKKAATKERYDGIYRNYIDNSPIYYIKLKDLEPSHIQNYYNDLVSNNKSISVINNLNKLVAPCIRYANISNRILKDFSKAIVLPKTSQNISKSNDVIPFTLNEQLKFIEATKGNDLEMLFITALDTGLRQGELFALTWNDIDLRNKVIYVNKTFKRVKNTDTGEYENIIQTPKTKKSVRVVPLPAHLIDKLRQYEIQQKELRIKVANLYEDNNLVFCNCFGRYLDSGNVLKKFKKILKENDIPIRKFHDLRHTYATRLFELGEDPKTVQVLLGHSNISITLDTYTHVLDSLKDNAISKLNDLYNKVGIK